MCVCVCVFIKLHITAQPGLLDAIVTSFVVLYCPPRNALPILPSTLAIDVNTPISTRFLNGTRDLLL